MTEGLGLQWSDDQRELLVNFAGDYERGAQEAAELVRVAIQGDDAFVDVFDEAQYAAQLGRRALAIYAAINGAEWQREKTRWALAAAHDSGAKEGA